MLIMLANIRGSLDVFVENVCLYKNPYSEQSSDASSVRRVFLGHRRATIKRGDKIVITDRGTSSVCVWGLALSAGRAIPGV